jgi:hypothetical protein
MMIRVAGFGKDKKENRAARYAYRQATVAGERGQARISVVLGSV